MTEPLYTLHRCPVCQGRGTLPCGFYGAGGNSTADVGCRPCNGAGILKMGACGTVEPLATSAAPEGEPHDAD